MARKRPVDSGETDSLGRKIKVADGVADRRPSAPPPDLTDDDSPTPLTDEQWADIWEMSEDLCASAAHKFGVDADEVRSMTMVAMGGMRGEQPDNMRAYLYTIARNAAWKLCYDAKAGSGYKRFLSAKAQLARLVDAKGGDVSDAELAEIAATVRVSGSSLPPGWHLWGRAGGDDAMAAAETRTAVTFEDDLVEQVDADDRLDAMASSIEAGEATGSKWSLLADAFDAPHASRGTISENTAPKVRELMRYAGGLDALIKAWDSLDLDADGERALFAPWGRVRTAEEARSPHFWTRWQPPSPTDQERVVDALRRVGPLGSDLWNAALSDATWVIPRRDNRKHKPRAI